MTDDPKKRPLPPLRKEAREARRPLQSMSCEMRFRTASIAIRAVLERPEPFEDHAEAGRTRFSTPSLQLPRRWSTFADARSNSGSSLKSASCLPAQAAG